MSNELSIAARKNIHCTISFAQMTMTEDRQKAVSDLSNIMRRVSETALTKATEFTWVTVCPKNKIVAKAFVDYVVWESMKRVNSLALIEVFQNILNVSVKYDAYVGEKFLETVSLNFNPNGTIIVAENEGGL